MTIEATIERVLFARLGLQLVQARNHDCPYEMLEIELVIDKVLFQRVHQGDIGGRVSRTQIIDWVHEPATQQVTHVAVNKRLAKVPVVR